jgi:hypothetical protein
MHANNILLCTDMEHIKMCIVCSNHSTTYKTHTDCESCALQEFKIFVQNQNLVLNHKDKAVKSLKISGNGQKNNIKMLQSKLKYIYILTKS